MAGSPVVFFDSQTLGLEGLPAHGAEPEHLGVYADIPRVLGELRPHARVGLVASPDGLAPQGVMRALGPTGGSVDANLVVVGGESPAQFAAAVERAGHASDPSQCILVSACRTRRTAAMTAGMRAAPHPALAAPLVQGRRLVYARIDGADRDALASAVAGMPLVGMHLDQAASSCWAVMDDQSVDRLRARKFDVEVLAGDGIVGATDLYLVRTDHLPAEAAERFRRRLADDVPFVAPVRHGLVVGVPGGRSLDEIHPPAAPHGHAIAFVPTVTHLAPRDPVAPLTGRPSLSDAEFAHLRRLTGAMARKHHEPWCGLAPDPRGRMLLSRNIGNLGNRHAVEGLAATLAAICGNVRQPVVYANGRSMGLANVEADIVGASRPNEIVIVSAHLDSTAGNDPTFRGRERIADAPGANDDGSGVAAVLAVAEVLAGLAATSRPARTIRFMLFNAEEYGFRGSISSASELKLRERQGQARVVAMIQMDMIGWTAATRAPRPFEVHASGADFPRVEAESAKLAELVAAAAGLVSPGLVAQRYPLPGCRFDPVAFRSDHNPFLSKDWPAIVVTEDEFGDACGTTALGDPHYHLGSDRTVNAEYVADIARAVAAAAWMLAAAPARGPLTPVTLTRTQEKKGTTMPTKFIHQFINDFINDHTLRCKVLKAEQTAMRQYGLDGAQISALISLDQQLILSKMLEELKDAYGLDLDVVRQVIWGGAPPPPVPLVGNRSFATAAAAAAPAASAAASFLSSAEAGLFYSEGKIHIRLVEPLNLPLNQPMDVTLRGQGFDVQPEVRFKHQTTQTTVDGAFLSSSCDVDVYQRIRVRVALTMPGRWLPQARNSPSEPWTDAEPSQEIVVA